MSEFDIRNTDLKETEKEFERALRPLNFGDFQGQKKIVENLEIFRAGCKDEGRIAGPCHPSRASRTGENDFIRHYCQRIGGEASKYFRTGTR